MNEAEQVLERLRSVYRAKSNLELGKVLNLSRNAANQWKARNTIPYKEVCEASLNKGVSLEWLLTGKGSRFNLSDDLEWDPELDGYIDDEPKLCRIPQYAIQASAGGGTLVEAEKIEQHLSLSSDWLVREGINSKDLIGIYARGDSMEPTIASGDSLLIDRTDNVIGSDGGIYVINYEGELFVKRVQKLLDGRIAVTSDNKHHMSIEISKHDLDRLTIIGRVVWFGRKIG